MSKQTNPSFLRAGFNQDWPNLIVPSRLGFIRYNIRSKVENFLQTSLRNADCTLFWSHSLVSENYCIVHAFVQRIPCFVLSWSIRRNIKSLCGLTLKIFWHQLGAWSKKTQKRRKRLFAILGRSRRFRSFRKTKYFVKMAAILRVAFLSADAGGLSSAICSILSKHNKRHWLFFKFLRRSLRLLAKYSHNLYGLRVKIAGKLRGRPRKKKKNIVRGRLPCQSFGIAMSYSCRTVSTKFGSFGLKVWVAYKPKMYNSSF